MNNNIFLHYCTLPGCKKRFKNKFALQRHMLSHTKEKPFACPICGKTFALKQYLKEHESIHKKIKPLVCGIDGCTLAFRGAAQLSRHRKCHTNYAPRQYDYSLNNNYPLKHFYFTDVNEPPSKVFKTCKKSSEPLHTQNEESENNLNVKIKIEESDPQQIEYRKPSQSPKSNKSPIFYISKNNVLQKKDILSPLEELGKSNSVSTTFSEVKDNPSNEKDLQFNKDQNINEIPSQNSYDEEKINQSLNLRAQLPESPLLLEKVELLKPKLTEPYQLTCDPLFDGNKKSKPSIKFEFPKLKKSIYQQALEMTSKMQNTLPPQNPEKKIKIENNNCLEAQIPQNSEPEHNAFYAKNEEKPAEIVSPSSSKNVSLIGLSQLNLPINTELPSFEETQKCQPIRPLPIHAVPKSVTENNCSYENPSIPKEGIETSTTGHCMVGSTTDQKEPPPHYYTYYPYLLLYSSQLKMGQVVGRLQGPSYNVPNPQIYSLQYNEWIQNFQNQMSTNNE